MKITLLQAFPVCDIYPYTIVSGRFRRDSFTHWNNTDLVLDTGVRLVSQVRDSFQDKITDSISHTLQESLSDYCEYFCTFYDNKKRRV